MKKALVIISLIGLLFVASQGICKVQNLVYNGDFEYKKTENIPSGWNIKVFRDTKGEYKFDEAEKHSGRYSYMISIKPPGGTATFYLENRIKYIRPGKSYRLSVWVKAKNLGYSPNFIAPVIRFNFRPEHVIPVPTIDLMAEMKGISGWKNLTFITIAPPNAHEMTLGFQLTNGTLWIDDVEITEVKTQ